MRVIPSTFRLNSIRIPEGEDAGKIFACVLCPQSDRGMASLALFVQGPLAQTTEEALRGLLVKMEGM